MDFSHALEPVRFGFAFAALLISVATMLAIDVRTLKQETKKAGALWLYVGALVFAAALSAAFAVKLSFQTCQPIPGATIESVLERLNPPAAEPAK